METRKIRKSRKLREKADTDEERFEELLEVYTMVPPSPHVLRKRRKKSLKSS